MNEKLQRIKSHIQNNWKIYTAATVGVVVGVVTVLVIIAIKSQNEDDSPEIAQTAIGFWKPQITQVATLITIDAPGNSGNVIQDLTTGIIYPSQNSAAEALGVDQGNISRQLAGKLPEVNGHIFKKIIDGSVSHELHAL